MNTEVQLRILQQAKHDPARLVLASVDLAYPDLIDRKSVV